MPEQLAFTLPDPNVGCARCRGMVGEREDETDPPRQCYFCYAPLCTSCLAERDHCGHEEMVLIDEYLALYRKGFASRRERWELVFWTVEQLRDAVERGRARALIPT